MDDLGQHAQALARTLPCTEATVQQMLRYCSKHGLQPDQAERAILHVASTYGVNHPGSRAVLVLVVEGMRHG